jgi:predicted nucleic acid-binding protein
VSLVLDASVVLTWCFPDEQAQKAVEIAERIAAGERVIVPAFWPHEILNALLIGEKRGRLTPKLTQLFLEDLSRLPVDLDHSITTTGIFEPVQALCRKHGLTSYDAAYLEVAVRHGSRLATVDDALTRAAASEGLPLLRI